VGSDHVLALQRCIQAAATAAAIAAAGVHSCNLMIPFPDDHWTWKVLGFAYAACIRFLSWRPLGLRVADC
jgi:hypothetical protein